MSIQVIAKFQHKMGMELESIFIKKGEVEMTLTSKDWEEINKTLKGKRKSASTEIKDGSYYPESMIVWN